MAPDPNSASDQEPIAHHPIRKVRAPGTASNQPTAEQGLTRRQRIRQIANRMSQTGFLRRHIRYLPANARHEERVAARIVPLLGGNRRLRTALLAEALVRYGFIAIGLPAARLLSRLTAIVLGDPASDPAAAVAIGDDRPCAAADVANRGRDQQRTSQQGDQAASRHDSKIHRRLTGRRLFSAICAAQVKFSGADLPIGQNSRSCRLFTPPAAAGEPVGERRKTEG